MKAYSLILSGKTLVTWLAADDFDGMDIARVHAANCGEGEYTVLSVCRLVGLVRIYGGRA